MKILNVCKDDWANFAYDNAEALKAAGADAKAVKLNNHIFVYQKAAAVLSKEAIEKEIKRADVVQIFHSDTTFVEACKKHGKRTIVYHAGSHYRDNFKKLNTVFNPVVEKSAIALGELIGLGAKNEVYVVGAVHTDKEPEITQKRPYIFGHFPSNSKVKGTEKIAAMMHAVQSTPQLSQFRYNTRLIDSEQQYRRMMGCDIYVELFQPELNGRTYGSFGITALEAAAMGKVVVTMNLHRHIYETHYGSCALQIANTEKEFMSTIVGLQFLGIDALITLRHNTRKWVVEKHSYKATGEYVLKNILS